MAISARIPADDTGARSASLPRTSFDRRARGDAYSWSAEGLEQRDVAALAVTEAKIRPDDNAASPDLVDERLLDEVLRRLRSSRLVEREHHDAVDTGPLAPRSLDLVLESGQQMRRGGGADGLGVG